MMKGDGGRGLSRRQVLKLGATAAAGAAMGRFVIRRTASSGWTSGLTTPRSTCGGS